MNSFVQRHHRFLFYSTWLILALAQSASTELIADEAYYWVYSRFPSWGYFDHPPMIALIIKSGYSVFQNELGVRLICALLSTLTILITESLTERKNPFLFYAIALSIGVLQIGGFLAVPDTPLLFFTALYFYVFRSFVNTINWKNALLLGISITLLFYTKYHGLLIVVFSFLSNIKLFSRWQTWLAALFVLILYTPHLLWQWEHDWISFRYHLFESNVSAYEFSYTSGYVLGQFLIAGPLAGIILLPAAFLYKTTNQTERALKFTLAGVYLIFFISSFRGKVEVNWTMPVLIPLIILSHQFIIDKISWIRPLRKIALVSLLLVIAGRLYLVADIGPDNSVKKRFHNNKAWARAIAKNTGDRPVVFYNSYQRASLFWFYSGKQSHSHNPYWDRRSNYDFWPIERNLLGKPVFIADIYNSYPFLDSMPTKKGWMKLAPDTEYAPMGGIKIIPEAFEIEDDVANIRFSCEMSQRYSDFLHAHQGLGTDLLVGVFNGKDLVKEFRTGISAQKLAGERGPFEVRLSGIPKGSDRIIFSIRSKNYLPTHNSEKIKLIAR